MKHLIYRGHPNFQPDLITDRDTIPDLQLDLTRSEVPTHGGGASVTKTPGPPRGKGSCGKKPRRRWGFPMMFQQGILEMIGLTKNEKVSVRPWLF